MVNLSLFQSLFPSFILALHYIVLNCERSFEYVDTTILFYFTFQLGVRNSDKYCQMDFFCQYTDA